MSIIDKNKLTLLDGAMGTMLQKKIPSLYERPELLCIKSPEIITDIHSQYINAGAEVIYSNTFGANELKLNGSGITPEQAIDAGLQCAHKAAYGHNVDVALDIGPIGELLQPSGTLSFERAYNIFKRMVIQGVKSGADTIIFETMTDLYEVKAAILAAKENSNLPIWVSMTFEENGRTFTGCSIEALAVLAESLNIDAVGINRSLGPDEIFPLAKILTESTSIPVFIKPNAGLPDPATGLYHITAKQFCNSIKKFFDLGISAIGGCCGTTPEFINELKYLSVNYFPVKQNYKPRSVVSTATKVININDVTVIGERINPTGKKLMRQALLDNNMDYIIKQAIEQAEAGEQILDINVGTPGVDEKVMLPKVVRAVQSITNLPLQLDSSDKDALENALRIYNGKPIVNSVNGNIESLNSILPIVKKYGASVIGLTLDENGIPDKAEDRFKIALKISNTAKKFGIAKEDIFIDCLTLTVSAQQDSSCETLKALSLVKNKLGLKTVLGISNISFGLPYRELLNKSFLLMALTNGLDLPIINPNINSMMDTIRAFRVLTNKDRQSTE